MWLFNQFGGHATQGFDNGDSGVTSVSLHPQLMAALTATSSSGFHSCSVFAKIFLNFLNDGHANTSLLY